MKLILNCSLLLLIAAGLTACGQQPQQGIQGQNESRYDLVSKGDKGTQNLLSVVGPKNEPIANAEILIGDKMDSPFVGNFVTTNADGSFAIPNEWNSAQPVTINALGYVRTTFMEQTPSGQIFKLRYADSKATLELNGKTSGYGSLAKDGYLDFGLTMPAMTKHELFGLKLTDIISPINDTITVAGETLYIPSNIALPAQKESYGIFPISLAKERYRLFFRDPGQKRVFALRGQFPFKQVVDELRADKEFYELINYFSLKSGSIKDIDLKSNGQAADLTVNDLPFAQKIPVIAPAIDPAHVIITVALNDLSNAMFPSDVKRLASGKTTNLTVPGGSKQYILSALKLTQESSNKNYVDRMSASILPYSNNLTPSFLPLIKDPVVINDFLVNLPTISTSKDITPVATYAALSKVDVTQISGYKMEITSRVWEVYAPSWIDRVSLPEWPSTLKVGKTAMRWEVGFIGSANPQPTFLGPQSIESATHLTKSTVDF